MIPSESPGKHRYGNWKGETAWPIVVRESAEQTVLSRRIRISNVVIAPVFSDILMDNEAAINCANI